MIEYWDGVKWIPLKGILPVGSGWELDAHGWPYFNVRLDFGFFRRVSSKIEDSYRFNNLVEITDNSRVFIGTPTYQRMTGKGEDKQERRKVQLRKRLIRLKIEE
jgi:hypothetical protein